MESGDRNIAFQAVVTDGLRPLEGSSRGCNPPDTTGYNPMLQGEAPGVEQLSKAAGVVEQDADPAGEGDNPRISSIGMLLYIDLATITREFIYANDLPCISVKRAVEAGLLVPVSGYEMLTRPL